MNTVPRKDPDDPEAKAVTATDAELIRRSLRSAEDFAALFDRHGDEIHRYVARRIGPEHAEDVVADTFLVAFRKRAAYDTGRDDARPWLYGIATHAIRDHLRGERRRAGLLARVLPSRAQEPFDERSLARVAAAGLGPRLAAALRRLSPAERDLLLLIAWADLSYEEAAAALGLPVGTVRSRLHRARRKARRELGDTDPLTIGEESWA